MNPGYKDKLATKLEKNFLTLEDRIMADIIRRIRKVGKITSTADWQINRLLVLGNSSEDIEKMIKEALNASYPEMFELYDQVIEWEYVRNKKLYEQINQNFIPYEKNEYLQQLTEGLIRQTQGELENFTQSLGFYLNYSGKRVLTPLAQVYQGYLDAAITDIASGAFDYNAVLRRTVTELTNSGLRKIEYASGRAYRANVAARMCVMTGTSQLTAKISDYNAEKLGTEHFEVAWHAGARPSHQKWQGKVYTREQLRTICGLGTAQGLLGVNCYHEYYPFFPGISERNWTDKWLKESIKKENAPKTFQGREYTLYQAKQRQREMERLMRAQREKVVLLQHGHADGKEVMLEKCKYQAQLDEYGRFSKKMGLSEERARIYLDMRGRIAPSSENYKDFIRKHPDLNLLPKQRKHLPRVVTNRYGQAITFDPEIEKSFKNSKEIIKQLIAEYETRLLNVTVGAEKGAGSVDISGATMRLNTDFVENAIHEFAHSMANSMADKYSLTNDKEFWKQIKSIKRKYRKEVADDITRWISSYEHGTNDVDEFFAEAFTQAKIKELGMKVPKKYGNDFTYSQQVLELVNKYFKKKVN